MAEKKSRAGKIGHLLLYIAGAYLVYLSFVGDYGLLRIHRLYGQQAALKANYRAVVSEAVDCSIRLRRLRSDPYFLEWLARTRYGYSRRDEMIFHLNPTSR
jgi:cell division protein FtsB